MNNRPIRMRGRFGCLYSPVCDADWPDVLSVGVSPVGKDVWIEYIGDEFSQCQSSDAAPLTELQDLYTLLHIYSDCATRLQLIWTFCVTVRISNCVEEVDCRPSLLPVSIPLSGLSPTTISGARSCVSYGPPEETGQSIMNMDTSEITINRIIGFEWNESGTDVQDEMPTPVASPTQSVVPATPPAGTADPFGRGDDFDLELAKVMCDVSVLPSLVAPLQEVEVPLCANAADYAAPATPALETVLESPGYTVPEDSGCSWLPGFVPVAYVVSADEGGYLRSLQEPLPPQAVTTPIAPMVADHTPQTVPLNPGESVPGPVTTGSPSSANCVVTNDVGPDLSREGSFDACDAIQEPGQSPMVLDSMTGCQYRMTSYEERTNRDDLDPSYGIHLHDPRMMEYMGAPESARLLGWTPEYWLEHMGRERTVQAALRLHFMLITKCFQLCITMITMYLKLNLTSSLLPSGH